MKWIKAFTLIELLIVVAIIAILAAIAVPNFLEAQTRSKVSRTKSDMRTMGVALRSYEVDNNRPPPNGTDPAPQFKNNYYFWWLWLDMKKKADGAGRYLTSPISYTTTLPADVFNVSLKGQKDNSISELSFISYNYYYVGKPNDGRLIMKDLAAFHPGNDPDAWKIYGNLPFRWALLCPGPDLVWYITNKSVIYDPTNGTISAGDLLFYDAPGLIGGGGGR